jgi:hypothetical protein
VRPVDGCGECGFEYGALPRVEISSALVAIAEQYVARLAATTDDALRRRPTPDVWSPLEYSAHVRDVLETQRERVMVALLHDAPTFEPMGREERVVEWRYNEQDPDDVALQIRKNADDQATVLDSLDDRGWARIGIYNWPTRQERDVAWIGRHTVHELVHHLLDVNRSLQGQPGTPAGIGSG